MQNCHVLFFILQSCESVVFSCTNMPLIYIHHLVYSSKNDTCRFAVQSFLLKQTPGSLKKVKAPYPSILYPPNRITTLKSPNRHVFSARPWTWF